MKEQPGSNWWIDNLLRPAMIAAMLACLVTPLVEMMEWMFAGWDGSYVAVFAFFAGLEGILSERTLRKRGIGGYGYLVSRGAEFFILLLLLKFASYVPLGLSALWADALRWSADPDLFLTPVDLTLGLLFLPLWLGAIGVARVVQTLDAREGEERPPPDKTSTEYYLWLTRPHPLSDRQSVLDWLGELFVWGGILLLLVSAAVHFFVSSAQGLAVSIMLYFALGIALLSQGQFSMLHIGWQIQDIPIQRGIARRWLLWVTIFLVGVALIALVLPTGYTMGPIQALLGLLSMLFNLISFLILLILFLLTLPLALILPNVETPTPPSLPMEPVPPPETLTGGGTLPWLEILLSALFWLLVLAIAGYALVRFLRDRMGSLSKEELQGAWWGRLLAWLRTLWRQWQSWRRGAQARRERRRAARQEQRLAVTRPRRFFFLGRLPPRELLLYFYLSVTRRAAQAGQPRRPGQTPYEYQSSLDERYPDLEPDLTGLTEAFVRARYSPHPVEVDDAETVKSFWQRIKAALRKRRISL